MEPEKITEQRTNTKNMNRYVITGSLVGSSIATALTAIFGIQPFASLPLGFVLTMFGGVVGGALEPVEFKARRQFERVRRINAEFAKLRLERQKRIEEGMEK